MIKKYSNMYMDTKIKIKNDFLKEIKDITKENNETILMKYNTLIKEGDDTTNEYNDTYIKVYNDICEKYIPNGVHN